ncbi:MAG: adenine deaminase [Firmicutes bacterium]|nr:adenine deaminase [Bacillota bacterium]
MKLLLKNAQVVNVFTDRLEEANVLIDDEKIIGVGEYNDTDADTVRDLSGKIICPGFIDGHIHIESTMLTPAELAKASLPCGTTAIIADPHEIANVCGISGITYMLEASENLPLSVYIMLPSCVPSTPFDETGAVLEAEDLRDLYKHPRVLGLGEMMNYPGVLTGDFQVMQKISEAHNLGKLVNGHAPLLSGKELDKYISAGIGDDHECSTAEEAMERISKGQHVMIRQGTAAKNLEALLPLFNEPWSKRCMLVTDDRHPADLISEGHIDNIIRQAVKEGKSPLAAIRMATLQTAEYFGIGNVGAVAPGYRADLLVLDQLDTVQVCDVYCEGRLAVSAGKVLDFKIPDVRSDIKKMVRNSFYMEELTEDDFYIDVPADASAKRCRIIKIRPGQLITDQWITEIDFDRMNGIDTQRDILKLAVIERHLNTGHKGLGFISGIGLRKGAIASSVSHDSHNLIVIGTNHADMSIAANRIRTLGGGNVVVYEGEIVAEMPLPLAGLMSDLPAEEVARQNEKVREAVHTLGASDEIEPFMNMAFLSLPVIPDIKMTTLGLVDVNSQKLLPLFAD